uniref:PKD/Chitinase domain-containing protein n=1 Tax=Periophthalmus magnuspinnatus TaxID=409849 RepID=A0A3B3ZL95_9GOBI
LLGPPPVAHAGGSYTLILPNNSLLLQGSVTNADPKTVHYLWTRDIQSPAAGDVLFGSESSSSLVLVNLVEGSYLFHLRVTDAWGRSATATATVQVLPEPGEGDEVELELQVSVSQVSVSQRDTVVSQIAALLHVSTSDIQLRRLYGHAQLRYFLCFRCSPIFLCPCLSVPLSHLLSERTDYLLFRVLRVDTVVCQLQCSGQGQCDPVSRLCLCDPFWTENLLRTYLGDGESNCEWRVLYVILSGFILVLLILSATWTFMCCCRRKRPSRVRRKTRYTILDNVDEQERVELRPKFSLKHRSTEHNSSLMMSESELSDQDFSRDPPLRNRTKPGVNQI